MLHAMGKVFMRLLLPTTLFLDKWVLEKSPAIHVLIANTDTWVIMCQTFCSVSRQMSWALIVLLSQTNPYSHMTQASTTTVHHFLPFCWAHTLCSNGESTVALWFNPSAIIGYMTCTEALRVVKTKAVASLSVGS